MTNPKFRGAALELQSAIDHELVIAGPAETGKTLAALWRLDSLLRETRGAKAVIIRKVRADMGSTVLETWERVIASRGGVVAYGGAHPEWYQYPNGSRAYIGGMDRPGKVLSGERDWIYVNQCEELSVEDWETLSTRCTGRGAVTARPMLFGDCNPGPPTHWILGRKALRLLHSRHEDNPTLYDDAGTITEQGAATMAVLDTLSGVRRERLRFGRWAAAEGAVYEAWDRGLHLVPHAVIPAEWRRIRAVDFGFTNPTVCQWWAVDPDGRMILYRELYRTRRLVEDHAKDIVRLSAGEHIEVTICDHDAEDRATLERHGVSTMGAFKAVSVGIEAVQARIRVAADGKPRLMIMEGALVERDEALVAAHKPVCTADELPLYAYPKGSDGKPLKEEPVKVDDHGVDAMRYAVAYIDGLTSSAVSKGWEAIANKVIGSGRPA